MDGMIFNIQPMSLQDGPGVRTTVFMKGCNLRCYWCHNPESLSGKPELQFFATKCIGCGECAAVCPAGRDGKSARFTETCVACGACADACFGEAVVLTGRKYSTDALFEILEKDRAIFQKSGGGVTFSGCEPLLQAEFVGQMLHKCKIAGINTAVETALNVPWKTIASLLPFIDHVICDLKVLDPQKHKEATGQDNAQILDNIRRLCSAHPDVLVRTPVIPAFNDNDEDIAAIAEFLGTLPHPPKAELLPFHGICLGKYKSLNRQYAAEGRKTPEKAMLEHLGGWYRQQGINITY